MWLQGVKDCAEVGDAYKYTVVTEGDLYGKGILSVDCRGGYTNLHM